MTSKEKIKKVILEDFNKDKNFKEITNVIEERKTMKSRNNLFKYVGAFASLILVTICGLLVINNSRQLKPIIDDGNNLIYINKIDNESIAKIDGDLRAIANNMTIKGGKFEYIEELKDYPFYKDLNISDEYNAFSIYAIYVQSNTTDKITEYDKLNHYIISYKVKDKEKEFKSIEIAFSKENKPLRDYYFTSKSDNKSTINGIELQIYQYNDSYMTMFNYDGINFDIETSNVSEKEFIDLLKSIIKKK